MLRFFVQGAHLIRESLYREDVFPYAIRATAILVEEVIFEEDEVFCALSKIEERVKDR